MKTPAKTIALTVFLVGILFALPARVLSQSGGEENIERYDVSLIIQTDGKLRVAEEIDYFFSEPHHGIFRNIPIYKTNEQGDRYKLTITDVRVVDESGNSYQFHTSQQGSDLQIKIGDPNRTISGLHIYNIYYTVAGALTYFSDHDELYWNAIGDEWSVIINHPSASISVESGTTVQNLQTTCFTGSKGNTTKDCAISQDGNTFNISADTLNPSEGLTIVYAFPTGLVAQLEPILVDTLPWFFKPPFIYFLAVLAVFWYILLPLYIPLYWYMHGRDPKTTNGPVESWFDPPKTKSGRDLTPVELGTLTDEHADARDLFGTLIQLAQRGYVQIIETKKKVLFIKSTSFTLVQKKSYTGDKKLLPFERDLLDALFDDSEKVKLEDVKLYKETDSIYKKVYKNLVNDGFFPKDPNEVRKKYTIYAGLVMLTFNVPLSTMLAVFANFMPRRTIDGVRASNEIKSLENFLRSQDRQLAFQAKHVYLFEKLLPFAIALGVEKIWAERFKNLVLPHQDWIVSDSGRFNSASMIALTNSFSKS